MEPAAPPAAGAVVVPVAAAAAPGQAAATALRRRAMVAKVLFVLGCAAAALALFAMTLDPANSLLGPCAPTDAEAEDLREAAGELLLAAAAQVLAATVAVLVPARPLVIFGCVVGAFTAWHASLFLPMVVACHGHVHGDLAVHYWIFVVVLCAALLVAAAAAIVA